MSDKKISSPEVKVEVASLGVNDIELSDSPPVVILQHGIFDSALGWLLNGKDSVGFRLAEMGFDVWLNNSRGNNYSRDHSFLEVNHKNKQLPEIQAQRKRFFDFSFHELGVFDQPALWNFVLQKTGV